MGYITWTDQGLVWREEDDKGVQAPAVKKEDPVPAVPESKPEAAQTPKVDLGQVDVSAEPGPAAVQEGSMQEKGPVRAPVEKIRKQATPRKKTARKKR